MEMEKEAADSTALDSVLVGAAADTGDIILAEKKQLQHRLVYSIVIDQQYVHFSHFLRD